MVWASTRTFSTLVFGFASLWWGFRATLLWRHPRYFFACGRSVGCSQFCLPQMSSALERRLAIVLDTIVGWFCCWLLSKRRKGCETMRAWSQAQQVQQQVQPHCRCSIVLCFAALVDLSVCGRSFDRLVGGLHRDCWAMHWAWLLGTPAKSKTVQFWSQLESSDEEKILWCNAPNRVWKGASTCGTHDSRSWHSSVSWV